MALTNLMCGAECDSNFHCYCFKLNFLNICLMLDSSKNKMFNES